MAPLELAVVVPTFRERDNIAPLLERLARALAGVNYEVVFVDDDSPDGTASVVRSVALTNPNIRVVQRLNRRGLASACVEGMMATAAPYVAVIDADLQHDESVLPTMLAKIKAEGLDLVIGTRNAMGGSMGDFTASRVRLSQMGRKLAALISHHDLSDPMSGFFLLRRSFLEEVAPFLSGVGFKILLDIVASSQRPVRIGEVPYRFGQRIYGDSKLDVLVGLEYLKLLLDKTVGRYVPVPFLIFAMVGTVGGLVHLTCLYLMLRFAALPFTTAQAVATVIGMTLNFFVNNVTTYRDLRLRGPQLIVGLFSFYAACSIGAFINLRVALYAFEQGFRWFAAGLIGVVVSSVWNYAVTAVFTWKRGQTRRRQRIATALAARRIADRNA